MNRECNSDLSLAFLSCANVDRIQAALAQRAFDKTGQRIGRQSDAELKLIMQSIYDAFGDAYAKNAKKEVRRLNEIVLEITLEQVVTGIESYLQYYKDASTLPEPLDRGEFATIKGTKVLENTQIGFLQ